MRWLRSAWALARLRAGVVFWLRVECFAGWMRARLTAALQALTGTRP